MTKPSNISIPHNLVTEQIVIAAALVDERSRKYLLNNITRDDFIEEQHGIIWESISELVKRKSGIDLQSVHSRVSNRVDVKYLKSLIGTYSEAPVTLKSHIDDLKWGKVRADVIRGPLSNLIEELKDPTSPKERISALARSVESTLSSSDRSFILDSATLAALCANDIERRSEKAVYPYGIKDFDMYTDGRHRMIMGAAPGETTSITGVSGSGKSVLATAIAFEQALMGRQVLYGAWEESPSKVIERLAMMSFGMSRYDIAVGNLNKDEIEKFKIRMEEIGQYIKFFKAPYSDDLSKKFTNDHSLNLLYQRIVDSGAEVIILDLWERGIPDGSPDAERRALWKQRTIAQNTSTHCILVCQQKLKEVESRIDKRPTRDTILGSSAWVDISDTIIGVHRPALWKAVPDNVIELLVLKQRDGRWPMTVSLEWNGDKCYIGRGSEIDYIHPNQSTDKISMFTKGKRR